MEGLKKLNIEVPSDAATSYQGLDPEKTQNLKTHLYPTTDHGGTRYNSEDEEATPVYQDRWMDTGNEVHVPSVVLLRHT